MHDIIPFFEKFEIRFEFDKTDRPNPGSVVAMRAVYEWVSVRLPLLDRWGGLAPAQEIRTRGFGESAEQAKPDWKYVWNPTAETTYENAVAQAKGLSPRAKGQGFADPALAWELPDNPWSLPLLVGSHGGDQRADWKIPVVIRPEPVGGRKFQPVGIYIRVKFQRTFPGPIPPFRLQGEIKGMESAKRFLTGGDD